MCVCSVLHFRRDMLPERQRHVQWDNAVRCVVFQCASCCTIMFVLLPNPSTVHRRLCIDRLDATHGMEPVYT